MTYRESAYQERCVACEKPATARCARCGDPGCDWHLFTDDKVCGPCHDAYEEQLEKRRDPRMWKKVYAIVWGTSSLVFAFTAVPLVGLGLGIGGALLFLVLRHHSDQKHRQRYLDERKRERIPPHG